MQLWLHKNFYLHFRRQGFYWKKMKSACNQTHSSLALLFAVPEKQSCILWKEEQTSSRCVLRVCHCIRADDVATRECGLLCIPVWTSFFGQLFSQKLYSYRCLQYCFLGHFIEIAHVFIPWEKENEKEVFKFLYSQFASWAKKGIWISIKYPQNNILELSCTGDVQIMLFMGESVNVAL